MVEKIKVSFHKLSNFYEYGPISLIDTIKKETESLNFGSLVDDLLFLNKWDFHNKYIIFDKEVPTASSFKAIQLLTPLFKEESEININTLSEDKIIKYLKDNGLWTSYNNIKITSLLLQDNFVEYLKINIRKQQFEDITIISQDDYNKALELVAIIRESEIGSNILNSECIFQYYFEYDYNKTFLVRGIFDIIQIDRKNKTIKGIDLKTGSENANSFIINFLKYKYYIQMYLYQIALEKVIKDLKLKNYKILPFEFLYISKFEKIPVIYQSTKKWLEKAKNGFITNLGYKYKGVEELLNEINWHFENNEFKVSKEIKENNFNLLLNDELIKDE